MRYPGNCWNVLLSCVDHRLDVVFFTDKRENLQDLAKQPKYENNSLSKLRENILKEFTTRAEARGIIFTKTRLSAIALSQWIQENPKFEECGVRASHLIGGGDIGGYL